MNGYRVSYKLYSWRTERTEKHCVFCPTAESAVALKDALELLEIVGAVQIGVSRAETEAEAAPRKAGVPALDTDAVWTALWKDQTSIGEFLTEPLDGPAAAHLARLVGQYNRFEPELVCRAIGSCPRDWRFEIGRSGSPVLYVTIVEAPGSAPVQAQQRVRDLFAVAVPDEVTASSGLNPRRVRLWWD
jgi:hypothetical protein